MLRAAVFSRQATCRRLHSALFSKAVTSDYRQHTIVTHEGRKSQFLCVPPTLIEQRTFPLPMHYASKAALSPSVFTNILSGEVSKFQSSLKNINLEDMKDAPHEAFWTSMVVGGSQLFIPLFELLTGYSPVLTFLQLHTAVITIGFMGGLTWGEILEKKITPGYMKYVLGLAPPALAITGLLLPYPLAFPMVGAGMIGSLAMNLRSGVHPPWSQALQMFTTMATVVGLLLALLAYIIFHNRQKSKKEIEEVKPSTIKEKTDVKSEGEDK